MSVTAGRRVFVAGHRGMVGSAIIRRLQTDPACQLITRERAQLDLTDQGAVERFFAREQPEQVYLAAARVGGIHANSRRPAEFIYQNLMIEANVVQAAYRHRVARLLLLGSSCIYPRLASQPIVESALLSGSLEPTNEPYAVAKIAGIKLCESFNRQYGTDYRAVMPTNLYGPGDNFHPLNGHVIPALLHRFQNAAETGAAEVLVWGSGRARREFLHVDDLAAACVHVMALEHAQYWSQASPMMSHINVGTGTDVSISALAEMVKVLTGFGGNIVYDTRQPDGCPRKCLDVSRLRKLGWEAGIELVEGLPATYAWYLANRNHLGERGPFAG